MVTEEFRSKRKEHFKTELSMFISFFRNLIKCINNSFKNYLHINEKGAAQFYLVLVHSQLNCVCTMK